MTYEMLGWEVMQVRNVRQEASLCEGVAFILVSRWTTGVLFMCMWTT